MSADQPPYKVCMIIAGKIRVAVNGYGVLGRRVAAAVHLQKDMELVGVADVEADWRLRIEVKNNELFHRLSRQLSLLSGLALAFQPCLHF